MLPHADVVCHVGNVAATHASRLLLMRHYFAIPLLLSNNTSSSRHATPAYAIAAAAMPLLRHTP